MRGCFAVSTSVSARVLEPRRDAVDRGQKSVLKLCVVGISLTPQQLRLNQVDGIEVGAPKLKGALKRGIGFEQLVLVEHLEQDRPHLLESRAQSLTDLSELCRSEQGVVSRRDPLVGLGQRELQE